MPRRRRGLFEDELAMVAGVTFVLMCLGAALLSIAASFR
jgi:hypothetical protein